MKTWSKEDTEKFIEIFPNTSNEEMSKIFNSSKEQIQSKAVSLKLKKSKEHKSRMIAKRNKMVGRDWNIETVKEIANSYKTKADFQRTDSAAYCSAQRNGWLEEVCLHMIKGSFSLPQLILNDFLKQLLNSETIYDTRKVIKPKELDIWIPEFKLAFEYDGKGWHEEQNNKKELCEKLGIKLIIIKENNRRYDEDIKNQLIENLELIKLITNIDITKEQVLRLTTSDNCFDKILDENDIVELCSQYTELKKFRIEQASLYHKIIKLKKLDFFTKHMKRQHIDWIKVNIEEIKKIILNYSTLNEFIEQEKGLYLHIMRNKELLYLLSNLTRKTRAKTIQF